MEAESMKQYRTLLIAMEQKIPKLDALPSVLKEPFTMNKKLTE